MAEKLVDLCGIVTFEDAYTEFMRLYQKPYDFDDFLDCILLHIHAITCEYGALETEDEL